MATLLDKTFDTEHGAVIVRVQDALGNVGVHTIYVLGLAGGTVDDAIAAILASSDQAAAAIQAAFMAAGWTNGNPPS
jgi:hypothetical protein